ncbi:MAG: dihydrodipicolinate synthase family protein [Bryobacteraceae bacterium]
MALIEGVHAALVTPRRPDSCQVDLGAALDLVDFVSRGGVKGIVLSGSTGEFPHFGIDDRVHLARFAVRRSPVPVMVNVSHSTLDGALALARGAASSGAAALLLMPPYFFRYSQDDILGFYRRFAKEAGVQTPVLLYNVPAFTSAIECRTAMTLLATELFAGIKDSSGKLDDFRRMMALKKQAPFTLLIGQDRIFAQSRAEGADGVVSGVAGVIPELLLGLDDAIGTGAEDRKNRLEERLHEFVDWIERFPFPQALKEALAARGLKPGPPAAPAGEQAQRLADQFREWFKGWLPGVLKEAAGS